MQTVNIQSKLETESATMMVTCGTAVPELRSLADNSEKIRKTRKNLLSINSGSIVSVLITIQGSYRKYSS